MPVLRTFQVTYAFNTLSGQTVTLSFENIVDSDVIGAVAQADLLVEAVVKETDKWTVTNVGS
jgi:hypothetical protein